jgi:hypothetical protein
LDEGKQTKENKAKQKIYQIKPTTTKEPNKQKPHISCWREVHLFKFFLSWFYRDSFRREELHL